MTSECILNRCLPVEPGACLNELFGLTLYIRFHFFPQLKRWKNRTAMFIAILTYKKPLEEVDRFLQAHRDYLAEHYAAGDFIASGPQAPRVGGVILIKAESRAVVDSIIEQDPFNINGVADYRIVEFTPTMFVESSLSDILK